jgi:hypothetical protein
MVLHISNISLTARAAPDFHRKRRAFRAESGEVFALVWVSKYTIASGKPAPGFEPGYMCGPLYADGLSDAWLLATLSDGAQFYFMPRSRWDAGRRYLIDKQGFLFSITPAA